MAISAILLKILTNWPRNFTQITFLPICFDFRSFRAEDLKVCFLIFDGRLANISA